jgi:hypothetical protein
MTRTVSRGLSVLDADDYGYDVVAKIVHLSPTASVIGFGLTAFGERDLVPGECKAGDYVAGRIKSDTPRGAGGLMSWAVSKTADPWV